MLVDIINGYPCTSCGGWEITVKKEFTYYWADFGTILIEEITNYICTRCNIVLIKVIEHTEEKKGLRNTG